MYRPDFKEFLLEKANTKRLSYYGKVSIDSYTYQEDIPQIDWVFGLPGLILAAQTEDKEHTFTAVSVRKSSSPITIPDKKYFKTTRERFNKALADNKANPTKSWKNSPLAPKDMNGKPMPIPKRKLFYSPLEKE